MIKCWSSLLEVNSFEDIHLKNNEMMLYMSIYVMITTPLCSHGNQFTYNMSQVITLIDFPYKDVIGRSDSKHNITERAPVTNCLVTPTTGYNVFYSIIQPRDRGVLSMALFTMLVCSCRGNHYVDKLCL